MSADENASLPSLYSGALSSLSRLGSLPFNASEKGELAISSLSALKKVHARIVELSLFSPNETVEDITTRDLIYLSLPFVLAEAQSRQQLDTRTERLESLSQTQRYVKSFTSLLETYNIVPDAERELFGKQASGIRDPAKKRQLKIDQYRQEKELKARIQTLRKQRSQQPVSDDFPSQFDLIASLLPSDSAAKDASDIASETDEILRDTVLVLLRLLYVQAQGQAAMLEQEVEMVKMMPDSPQLEAQRAEQDDRTKRREEEASMWRLDPIRPSGGPDGKGPLLDSSGRVLRPFTILPSDAGERQRLQSEVFGPSHNLPTMTIDDYLQFEKDSGRIITGGGISPGSENQLTSSEQLQLDSEMDGTADAMEKEEQKRQKDEKWASFTDANPRGAGNTMNRG